MSNSSMPDQSKPTLSTIPAEIRDRIFEFAIYHPDGEISQVLQSKSSSLGSNSESAPGRADNRLTHRFLIQPPLTRVNREIREEALCVFYQVNHFSFDFFETGYDNAERSNQRHCDWWRAIGDTNLRHIRDFNLRMPSRVSGLRLYSRYERLDGQVRGRLTIRILHGPHVEVDIQDVTVQSLERASEGRANLWVSHGGANHRNMVEELMALRDDLAPHVASINENGLNVLAIECLVGIQVGRKAGYLRDFSALAVNDEVVARAREWEQQLANIMMEDREDVGPQQD